MAHLGKADQDEQPTKQAIGDSERQMFHVGEYTNWRSPVLAKDGLVSDNGGETRFPDNGPIWSAIVRQSHVPGPRSEYWELAVTCLHAAANSLRFDDSSGLVAQHAARYRLNVEVRHRASFARDANQSG